MSKMSILLDDKSKVVVRNASYSLLIKSVSISTNFMTIPLILSFLSTTQYGLWLTLSAVLSWFSLFDLGLGNGLRNRLTIALAEKNHVDARIYVSTTYAALLAIFIVLLLLFWIINPFISWAYVFNAPTLLTAEISTAVFISISCLFVQFILRLINTVLLSIQKSAIADFANALIQVCTFGGIYLLKALHKSSLEDLSLVYGCVPVVIFLLMNIFLFSKKFRHISPSFKLVNKKYVNNLLSLGINFFVIQISALVLYASDNFIIAQFFKPSEVTIYNVSYKYFSITSIIFAIILPAFWSMTTKAYAENDFDWIKKTMSKLLWLWLILSICGVIQLFLSDWIYNFWTKGKVAVPFQLSLTILSYYIFYNLCSVFSNFLNAVGKMRVQLYYSIFAMIINIPLAIFFIKVVKIGVTAIPLATTFVMLGASILIFIQYKKILNRKATNIWGK